MGRVSMCWSRRARRSRRAAVTETRRGDKGDTARVRFSPRQSLCLASRHDDFSAVRRSCRRRPLSCCGGGAGLARAVRRRAGEGSRRAAVLPVDSGRGDGRRRAQPGGGPRAGACGCRRCSTLVFAALAFLSRARPVALGVWSALAALSAGFLSMGLRTARVATPMLDHVRIVKLQGFVEEVDIRPVGARLVLARRRRRRHAGARSRRAGCA